MFELKKYGKKIVASLLMFVMILGLMPGSMMQAKAASNLSLTWEGGMIQKDNNRYGILLSGKIDTGTKYDLNSNNVAYVDDTQVTDGIFWYIISDTSIWFYVEAKAFGLEKIEDLQGSHTVVIPAGTTIGNNTEPGVGGVYTLAEEIRFRVNADSVKNLPAQTELHLTYSNASIQSDMNRYAFVFKTEEKIVTEQIYQTNNVAYLDGKKVTDGVFWWATGENEIYFFTEAKAFGKNAIADVEGEHEVVIKADTTIGNNQSDGADGRYRILQDFRFVFSGTNIKYKQPQTDLHLTYSNASIQSDFERYAFAFKTEEKIVTEQIYQTNNIAYLDGNKVTDGVFWWATEENEIYFFTQAQAFGKDAITDIEGEHTIKIVADTTIGNTEAEGTDGKYVLQKDFEFTVTKDSIKRKLPQEHVTLSDSEINANADENGSYFVTEPGDTYPVAGWLTPVYFVDGGVSVDGVFNESIYLKKIAENTWFVCLVDAGIPVKKGTKVTVNGAVQSDEKEIVFAEETFVFDGDAWKVYRECAHQNCVLREGQKATCTTDGYEAYYECSECKALFADEAATTPIDALKVIAKHKATFVKAVASTYTKTGMKAYYKCSCGKLYTDKALTKVTTKAKLTVAKKTLAKPAVKSVAGKSKATLVKWAKKSGVTGYEIQVCSDKKCKKIVKKTTVKGASKVTATVKGLKGKKTYYVRIRTYKTEGKLKAYSAWSGAKKVTTKK